MRVKRHVGPKGQVVIPKDIRQALGVIPGSVVELELRNGTVVITPAVAPEETVRQFLSVVRKKIRRRIDIDSLLEQEHLDSIADLPRR